MKKPLSQAFGSPDLSIFFEPRICLSSSEISLSQDLGFPAGKFFEPSFLLFISGGAGVELWYASEKIYETSRHMLFILPHPGALRIFFEPGFVPFVDEAFAFERKEKSKKFEPGFRFPRLEIS